LTTRSCDPRLLTVRPLPLLLIGLIAALVVAVPAAARVNLVTAKVPLNNSVSHLLRGSFKETVSCTRACSLRTSVRIRPQVARTLGFKGVRSGQLFQIATNSSRLRVRGAVRLGFVLTPQAKSLLPRVKSELQLIGTVNAVTTAKPAKRGTASWIVTLSGAK